MTCCRPPISPAARKSDKAPVAKIVSTAPGMTEDTVVAAPAEAPANTPAQKDGTVEAEPVVKTEGEPGQDTNDADPDTLLVDEKLLKEEQLARAETEKAVQKKPAQTLTKERLAKLDVLLDKAQMYSLFLVEQVTSMQEQLEKARPCPAVSGAALLVLADIHAMS